MSSIVASIVVSTRNRCEMLPGALEALLNQGPGAPDYEIIVVDNNSSDATPAVVRSFERVSGGRVRYVLETREGVSHGRNRGISASNGAVIGFTDDDVRVAPDWIVTALHTLGTHHDIDYVSGPILPVWSERCPAWLTRAHWSPIAAVDFGPAAFVIPRDRAVCLMTASLMMRRAAIDAVGWFNPGFRRCQDRELMLRLWKAGREGLYNPAMKASTIVTRDRLLRRYHRGWHATHGEFLALMPLRERKVASGWIVEPSSASRSMLGAPLFECRALAEHVARWCAAILQARPDDAFIHELRARYSLSFLRCAVRRWMVHALTPRHVAGSYTTPS